MSLDPGIDPAATAFRVGLAERRWSAAGSRRRDVPGLNPDPDPDPGPDPITERHSRICARASSIGCSPWWSLPAPRAPGLRTQAQPPPARSRPGRRGGRPRPLRAHTPPAAAKGLGPPARRRLGGGGPRPALLPSGRRGLRSMLRACSSRGRRASGAGSAPLRPARHGRV